MTQAPQVAPAGWYPSPDGAPVRRWWDGSQWTDAASPLEPGPAVSGWALPGPPPLGALSVAARVFAMLTGLTGPTGLGAHVWRQHEPPAWLGHDLTVGLIGAGAGFFVVATVFWLVWQHRALGYFPPDQPRPRLLRVWWVLWLAGALLAGFGALWPWVGFAASLLVTAAVPCAWLVVVRLTRAMARPPELVREHPDA